MMNERTGETRNHEPDQDGIRRPVLLGDRADGAPCDGRCHANTLLGRQVLSHAVVEKTTGEDTRGAARHQPPRNIAYAKTALSRP